MQTITVFGGTGFLGRTVVRALAQTHYCVRVARRAPTDDAFLRSLGDVGQVVPVSFSRLDREQAEKLVAGADGVVNLIGVISERKRGDFLRIHRDWPKILAEVSHDLKIKKFLHVSALGAHEESASQYFRSKAAGESAVHAAFPFTTVIRPSIIFGENDHFFTRFANMARYSPFLPTIGGGNTVFQPVYVLDVAEAIVRAVGSAEAQGKIFELGGPVTVSFYRLLKDLLEVLQIKRPLIDLPWLVAKIEAQLLQFLPSAPLTPDQVEMLKTNTVVSSSAQGFEELGISPAHYKVLMPLILKRYCS